MNEPTDNDTAAAPRRRDDELGRIFTVGQMVVAALFAITFLGLIAHTIDAKSKSTSFTEAVTASDAAGTLAVLTLTDSLSYALRIDEWLDGRVPFTAVQAQRAALQAQLDATTVDGRVLADLIDDGYFTALAAVDDNLPPSASGLLAESERPAATARIAPPLAAFEAAASALTADFQRITDESLVEVVEIRVKLQERGMKLVLGTAALAVVLVLWTVLRLRRWYGRARRRLDDDRDALEKVTALERAEAEVLADIVRGDPLDVLLVRLLDLAERNSGHRFRLRCSGDGVVGSLPRELHSGAGVAPQPAGGEVVAAAWPVVVDGSHEVGSLELLCGRDDAAPGDDVTRVGGRVTDLAALMIDRSRASQRLQHQATHDPLTGLPNRLMALDAVAAELFSARTDPAHGYPAVVFCDIDRFKLVNDSLGHRSGDRLLRSVAQRLARATDLQGVTLTRLGGDEFVAVCVGADARTTAEHVARRITEDLEEPFEVDGSEVFLAGTMGIAVADADTATPEDLIRNADIAMYRAKRGHGSVMVYDAALEADLAERLSTDSALRRGIENDELRVFLQPIYAADDGAPHGVEALVRWEHDGRTIPPGEFLPIAEETGLINEIGRVVIEKSLDHVTAAVDVPDDVTLWVNLAFGQLRDPSFVPWLLDRLDVLAFAPQRLTVELTEGTMMDLDEIGDALAAMQAAGIRVAMDDFGTGYSSLEQLSSLPVDIVKIDRSFVAALGDGGDTARGFLSAAVALVGAVGLDVVAEGVETDLELATVKELGCRYVQGFLLCRPGPADEILARVAGEAHVTTV